MNTRELIHYINTIADNIPIVKSFNDTDPYTYWNSQEVKYGSVVFAVKGYNQLSGVTRYNCVIYYGDRVLKDESNVNNIYTDAQTTINTIITNVELADGTVTVVSGSPAITFFRQRFLDELAGGYCNFTIEADDAVGACGYGHGEIIGPGGGSIEVEVLMEKIRLLQNEVSQLEAEVESDEALIVSLRAEVAELEEIVEPLRREITRLEGVIADKNREIAGLESQISSLNDEISGLESQAADLQADVAERDATILTLRGQIGDLNAEITRLEGVIDQKDATISNLEGQITTLQNQVSSLEGQISTLEGQVSALGAEITRLEGVVYEKNEEITVLEGQITTLQNRISSLEGQVSNLEAQVAALNLRTVTYMFGQVQSTNHVFYYDGDDGGDYSAIIAELPQGWTAVALHNFTINATPDSASIQISAS